MSIKNVTLTAIPSIPLINKGDDIGEIICSVFKTQKILINDGDVLVIASKIFTKAEGKLVSLKEIIPSDRAKEISAISGKDPRIVELMLKESTILEVKPGVVVTRHRLGFECTSAGIDRANTGNPSDELVSLLPNDPDQSARKVSDTIFQEMGKRVGVVINDSFGINGRYGSIGLAIGLANMPGLIEQSGRKDLYGKSRNVKISFVDEIAAAGSLLMGQADDALPVVLIHGLLYEPQNGKLSDVVANN